MEILEYIKELHWGLQSIHNDALNNVPLDEDEYYESDDYYQGAIETLSDILTKFGVHHEEV